MTEEEAQKALQEMAEDLFKYIQEQEANEAINKAKETNHD